MKKNIALFCALVLLFTTAFSTISAPLASAEDPVTISLWTSPDWKGVWAGEAETGNYGDFFRYAAEEFMKVNPDIKVSIEVVPAEERSQKLAVGIESGTLPDIYVEGDFTMFDYAHAGLLAPINSIVTDEDKADISTALWDMVTANGDIYMFPFFSETGHLAINLDICEKYGINPKDYIANYGADDEVGRWTPDEFKALLTALKAVLPDGIYPYGFFCGTAAGDTFTRLFMTMYGGTNFDPATKLSTSNSPECVRALEFLEQCNSEGLFAPGAETMTVLDTYTMFQAGQLAVSICNNVNYDQWLRDHDTALKMMYLPNEGDPSCYAYDKGSCVFDNGDPERIEAALKFIDFYSHGEYPDASLAMLPLRASVAEKVDDPIKRNLILSSEYAGDFWVQAPAYSSTRAYFFPEVQAVLIGTKTAQQAMDDAVANINSIVEEQAEMSVLINK